MLFRRATENDFAEYVRLYNNLDTETIYQTKKDINPQKRQEAIRYFGLDRPENDWLKQLEEYERRTPEKFLADISNANHRIIMIQNSKRTVGFIELWLISRNYWKIAYLCLEKRYQTSNIMEELMQYLEKKEKMHRLDVCSFGGRFDKVLKTAGFIQTGPGYLRKVLGG